MGTRSWKNHTTRGGTFAFNRNDERTSCMRVGFYIGGVITICVSRMLRKGFDILANALGSPSLGVNSIVHNILEPVFEIISFPTAIALLFDRKPGSSFGRDKILRSLGSKMCTNVSLVGRSGIIFQHLDHVRNMKLA